MQESAFFSVMEPMGNSAVGYGMQNQKLIRRSDVVFNDDSGGKKISFDEDIIEGPTHWAELAIRQTIEIDLPNKTNPLGRIGKLKQSLNEKFAMKEL